MWNQREWVKAGDDVTGSAWSMVSDGGKVYVSGYLNISGSFRTSSLAVWDGVKWELVDAAPFRDGFIGPLALGNGVLYASGVSQNGSAIAAWDGTSWSVLATNAPTSLIWLFKGRACMSVGPFQNSKVNPRTILSNGTALDGEHWAAAWTVQQLCWLPMGKAFSLADCFPLQAARDLTTLVFGTHLRSRVFHGLVGDSAPKHIS